MTPSKQKTLRSRAIRRQRKPKADDWRSKLPKILQTLEQGQGGRIASGRGPHPYKQLTPPLSAIHKSGMFLLGRSRQLPQQSRWP